MTNDDLLAPLNRVLGILEGMMEERGVPKEKQLIDKNIVKSESSKFDRNSPLKVSPTLSSAEKTRYTAIFTLFSQVFFKFQENQKEPETSATRITAGSLPKEETDTKKEKGGFGSFISMLMGGIALVAMAIPAILAMIVTEVGPIKDMLKLFGKTGLLGGLKLMIKAFTKYLGKAFGKTVLKRIPIIGSLFNFWMAYEEFKADRPVAGILEIIAGIANFVPGVGTILSIGIDALKAFMDAKGMFDEGGSFSSLGNAWSTIKGWSSDIYTKYIEPNLLYMPIIGGIKRFGMAGDLFKSGDIKGGLKELLLGILTFGGGGPMIHGFELLLGFLESEKEESRDHLRPAKEWIGKVKDWIFSKLEDLPMVLKKPLEWFGILPDKETGETQSGLANITSAAKSGFDSAKGWFSDMWGTVKGPMKEGIDNIVSISGDVWNDVKEKSKTSFDAVWNWSVDLGETMSDMSSKAFDKFNEVRTAMGDAISSLASKANDKIKEWVPKIVGMVTDIVDKAKSVLSGIVNKIGGWIGKLFGKEEEEKLKTLVSGDTVKKTGETVIVMHQSTTTILTKIHDTAIKQNAILQQLVNVNIQGFNAMVKSNTGKGMPVSQNTTIKAPQQSQDAPLVPITNGRGLYADSAYALA